MRILCIADIHGDLARLVQLRPQIDRADLLLVAGDLTEFGGREEVDSLLAALEGSPAKMAMVGGNCDRPGARKGLEASGYSVDGLARGFDLGQGRVTVVGSGGGLLRTGLTPYERREGDLAAALEAGFHDMVGFAGRESPIIVLTHNPPWGSCADIRHGGHTGSRAFRNLLDALSPMLWVCGHIHESRAAGVCDSTLVVNPGPLREGCFALVHLDEEGKKPPAAELLVLPPC